MVNAKAKRKNHSTLNSQDRLLKESLRQLLGPALGQSQPHRSEREKKSLFLRDALNSKILDSEWLS